MKLNRLFVFIFVLIALNNSCYKHEEGCRDVNALNYNVMADNDCEENCCKYPNVSLDFKLYFDTVRIDTNTFFANDFGDSLRVRLLRMYFSNFAMIKNNAGFLPMHKLQTLGIGNDSIPVFKSIDYTSVKVNETGRSFGIGTLNKLAKFDGVDFSFGIDSIINHADIRKITTSNYLHQFSDSMYINRDTGYYFMKLFVDVKNKPEKDIEIFGDKYLTRINLRGQIDFEERDNHLLPIKFDLNKWMHNIDFSGESNDKIANSLVLNLNNALEIRDK